MALGTDGVASNNSHNLFGEMKLTGILHKRKSPDEITAQQVLDMATVNGAEALGKQDIGSIKIGNKADLITVPLNEEMTPIHGEKGLISNLIFSFNGAVEDVIVDGKLVVEGGEHVELESEEVLEEVQERSRRFR